MSETARNIRFSIRYLAMVPAVLACIPVAVLWTSIRTGEAGFVSLAILVLIAVSAAVALGLRTTVEQPLKTLTTLADRYAEGKDGPFPEGTAWSGEFRQLEHSLRTLGEKYRELLGQKERGAALFDGVPSYVGIVDRDLRVLKVNAALERDYHPEPGARCYAVFEGRPEPCGDCPVLPAFQDGRVHYGEKCKIGADGTTSHWLVQAAPIRNGSGEIETVMEVATEITRQVKGLEKEIRRSEAKYRVVFDNIPNPVFVLDMDDLTILDCNQSVSAVYGFEKGEVVDTPFSDYFEKSERDTYTEQLRVSDAMTNVRQVTNNGRHIYVNIRISVSEYMGREALLVTTSDVTKRLMAEQQLIQASKMSTLGEMATGVAHELNQPLSVIKTASGFLIKKVKKAEPIGEEILRTMAEEIDGNVDRASKIINHLREFGRKSEISREKVSVNEPLERSLELFSQQLKLRRVDVLKELAPELPPILANMNRLEQVFINLLINARDAIVEKCGPTGEDCSSNRIVLRTGLRNGKVFVEIEDTGAGIDPAMLDKIFEPFFTTKKVGKGTGLGLSISYGIVQDYEGTIDVETVKGEGSKFIIQFPVPVDADAP